MIINHGIIHESAEYKGAELIGKIACDYCSEIANSNQIVLELFPSVQCFGQNPQDVDLLVFYADYRPAEMLFKTRNEKRIHSFCATIEMKNHSPEDVRFEGSQCSVIYNGERHNVTNQSEKQKYSVMNYIEKNSYGKFNAPWIVNLILLNRVNSSYIPNIDTNILGMDVTWEHMLEIVAMLASAGKTGNNIETFTSRKYLHNVLSIFAKRLEVSKLDRKRLELLTKSVLDRTKQQYAEKLGKQLLIFRGRGGTGKTVRLIQIAYQAYDALGMRILLLTYNKALVADLKRLLTLMHVKDAIGEGSISIKTIHSFMHDWLTALGVIKNNQNNFINNYEQYKQEAISLLKVGAISPKDIDNARSTASRKLLWDLILIDESQDWPISERDLIYQLYGYSKVIIADGVDQFVRGVDRIDWRESLDRSESQVVPLTKSLRLKASLCQSVTHFAEQIEYGSWNLEPLPESHGGKVIVVSGNALSDKFHKKLAATARADGNCPIDILLCVPPTWVEEIEGQRQSIVAKTFRSWGWDVWDATNQNIRDEYPTSLNQFRIVQYDSCRGLEGWVVVCFGLDEFYEHKRLTAEISETEKSDLFYEKEVSVAEYAKRWLMIPLTRAIDTLVIHVSKDTSYVGSVLKELYKKYPEDVQWIKYD